MRSEMKYAQWFINLLILLHLNISVTFLNSVNSKDCKWLLVIKLFSTQELTFGVI